MRRYALSTENYPGRLKINNCADVPSISSESIDAHERKSNYNSDLEEEEDKEEDLTVN